MRVPAANTRILAGLALAILPAAIALAASAPGANEAWRAKVDPVVLARAAGGEAEFIVYLREQADLGAARTLRTKAEKGRWVHDTLVAHANATQAGLRATLAASNVPHRTFWISNAVWVRGDLDALQAIAARAEVGSVQQVARGGLQLPAHENAAAWAARSREAPQPGAVANLEPGIALVNAAAAWALGASGQGVVVAGADTGVRFTHASLRAQYRGWGGSAEASTHDYHWKDSIHVPNWPPEPLNACNPGGATGAGQASPTPCDDDVLLGGGHGSHTVGSMVGFDGGANAIGMAPGAKWMACRNMSNGVGNMLTYLECMEWFIAPTKVDGTNPDPARAPHVINNSWGCVEGCPPEPNPLRDSLVASRAAGIVYVASAGNDGDVCNTIYHPLARYPEAFTVGSTTHDTDLVSSFSSRGPSAADPQNPGSVLYTKPNISAPGSDIRSALRGSDDEYGALSGTSMAGPHVAGLVALVISANPSLAGDVDAIEDIIEQSAAAKTTTEACGGDSASAVPNNTYGAGRIDALAAVVRARALDVVFVDSFD